MLGFVPGIFFIVIYIIVNFFVQRIEYINIKLYFCKVLINNI